MLGEITDAHPLDPVFLDGQEILVIIGHPGNGALGAGHQRHGRSIDIRIRQADPVAQPRQGDGQVDGDRGLAHTAFAGSDPDDVPHLRQFFQGQFIDIGLFLGLRFFHDNPFDLDAGPAG